MINLKTQKYFKKGKNYKKSKNPQKIKKSKIIQNVQNKISNNNIEFQRK
jgi:hypothetical protein